MAATSKDAGLAFFRITVLGMGNSGKTSLISSFVNNYCPLVYTETDDPTLYYKTVRLQGEDYDAKSFSVLVEIEDTYSSFRGDGKSYGRQRDVKQFLDMSRSNTMSAKGKKDGSGHLPFSSYAPPHHDTYSPLTKGRMGFLVVFDATDTKSYEEALNILLMLDDDLKKKKSHWKPVIYLVANKIDKDPACDVFINIINSAEVYSLSKMIRFWQVSALEYKRVKKMFREMLNAIKSNQTLWLLEEGESTEVMNEVSEKQCCIQ